MTRIGSDMAAVIRGISQRARLSECRAAACARIGLSSAILKDSMQRQRAALQSIVGIYEEQAARKQYDILGDGSV